MAGGRRCPGGKNSASTRIQVATSNNFVSTTNSCLNTGVCNVDEKRDLGEHLSLGRPLAPKHVPVPAIPVDGQILFEAVSMGTSIVAVSLQLLNLYKTVWWLPQSYNDYSMNFYLIDPYLLLFIVTMITRQFVYALLCKCMNVVTSARWLPIAQKIMRMILLVVVMGILFWCLYHMSERHNSIKVFYLCYPMSIYFLMFGASIGPFFDISTAPVYIKEDRKTKFLLDKPLHNCSLNAPAIRNEVASLRSDFNRRLKRALFASSGCAYLCGIAPVIFVPQHLQFDAPWVVQHILLIWLGRLGANFTQAYPVKYCDVLHRAALHLGKWSKIRSKESHLPAHSWSETILWPHGSIVRHNKELYKSEGVCTAAEPGNSSHNRFYILFGNSSIVQCILLALELTLVGFQLTILIRTTEWYKILSVSLLLVTNYYTLFRLVRDYLVCWKVYLAEEIVQEKAQMVFSNNAH